MYKQTQTEEHCRTDSAYCLSLFLLIMGYTRISAFQEQTTPRDRVWLHIGLFLFTFVSCMMAGTQWAGKEFNEISHWGYGATYAFLITTFLAAHEFGHYFAARRHGVDATLPYFIPVPFVFLFPFGTMGAVIKTRTPIYSRKALFDIGVAGPLAGFVMCVAYLIIGYTALPSVEYLYSIHPEYRAFGGAVPVHGLYFGDTILMRVIEQLCTNPAQFVPPMNEIYHYPYLCVGWFGLFVTSLNLLPIGQLDGGHILYAMFGSHQRIVARIVWTMMLILGIGSFIGTLQVSISHSSPDAIYTFFQSLLLPVFEALEHIAPWLYKAWGGWLLWAILGRVFFKLDHPALDKEEPIGWVRMTIGWLTIIIFIVSFSWNGLYEIPQTPDNMIPTQGAMIRR